MSSRAHVKQTAGEPSPAWILENDLLAVSVLRDGLALSVFDRASGKRWEMEPESKGLLIQRSGVQAFKPLSALGLEEWCEVREGAFGGIELRSVCPDPWIQHNVRIRFLLSDTDAELIVTVSPHEDPGYTAERWIREVYYPRSFVHSGSGGAYTALPFQQGTLLPGNWPDEIGGELADNLFRPWSWEAGTGPWWGHVDDGGAGYLAIIDTPDDAVFDLQHPAGGPTRVAPYWLTSFEALRYPRRMIYRFFAQCDHTTLALSYRDYCRRIGRWRSIEEKLLEKPQLDKLRGAIGLPPRDGAGRARPWIRAFIVHLRRDGVRKELRTFQQIADALEETANAHPDENIFCLLSGWQTLGYDHAHPAACPPCPEAGGWEGMRRVSETARRLGFLFGTHEQYRDFFYSSPFWSEDLTRKDSRRDSPRHAYWAGATQSILCPRLMLDFVKMNVQQLRDQHVWLDATYQDVLTAIPLEECYDHRHPATRAQCREARYSILEYYRDLGWLIGSESASDWAAPALDWFSVHWPRMVPGLTGEAVGIPVPLFGLVFHDSGILTSTATPTLICALSGVNTMQPEDRLLRRLHAHAAYMPLTAHRLLSDDGQQQESVFGDEVRVRADLSSGAYRVSGLPGEDEVSGELQDGHM